MAELFSDDGSGSQVVFLQFGWNGTAVYGGNDKQSQAVWVSTPIVTDTYVVDLNSFISTTVDLLSTACQLTDLSSRVTSEVLLQDCDSM